MHWIAKRFIRSVASIFVVTNLSFVLIYSMPGGPEAYLRATMQGPNAQMSQQEIEAMAELYLQINPTKPLHEQYVDYMSALSQGDFGQSIWYQESVSQLLADALPWTLFVMSLATLLVFPLGVILGAIMAYLEGKNFDYTATGLSIITNSIPYYVLAIIAVWILGFQMDLFPEGGRMDDTTTPGVNVPFIKGALYHAALPVLSFVISGFGGYALAMRGNSIRVLGEEYLRVARIRGLPSNLIATRYVGRNAILPLYTSLLISIGAMFGGSVILEEIFVYRGIGYYLYQGTVTRDYPLMMGAFVLITAAVITGIFIAELTYGWVDPRASEGGAQNESY